MWSGPLLKEVTRQPVVWATSIRISLPHALHLLTWPTVPKRKLTIYIPAKEKDEWVRSATGKKRRKKEEAYFNYMGKLLKQVHPHFSGCSWILDALRVLKDWQLEWVSLEAVRLSLYNHRRTITTREILEAVKQRCSQRSLGINEVDLHGSVVEMIALVQKQKIVSFGGLSWKTKYRKSTHWSRGLGVTHLSLILCF